MFRNTPYSSARGALCLFWATGFAVRRQGMRRLRSAQFSGERNQLLHTALRHAPALDIVPARFDRLRAPTAADSLGGGGIVLENHEPAVAGGPCAPYWRRMEG